MSNSVRNNKPNTTPSQNATLEHIAYLVFCEKREACWRDFLDFEVDSRRYRLKAGTIRNNLSKLRRQDCIEVAYRSIYSYYRLSGHRIQKKSGTMTSHPVRVYRRDLAALIERMAFDAPAVHNIRLRFYCQNIWKRLSDRSMVVGINSVEGDDNNGNNKEFSNPLERPRSKDLVLKVMKLDSGITGSITVHKSDVVSVIISCSELPINLDNEGMSKLSTSLARIEERLRSMLFNITTDNADDDIPDSGTWTVTMWHVNRDSPERYDGDKFAVSWEDFAGEILRVYTKEIGSRGKGRKRKSRFLRVERQEYPNDSLRSAVEQKLSSLMISKAGREER